MSPCFISLARHKCKRRAYHWAFLIFPGLSCSTAVIISFTLTALYNHFNPHNATKNMRALFAKRSTRYGMLSISKIG